MDITAAMEPMFNRITAPAPTIRCTIIGVRTLMLIPIRVKRARSIIITIITTTVIITVATTTVITIQVIITAIIPIHVGNIFNN
jgi:hypothetical protein